MAKRPSAPPPAQLANVDISLIPAAITKLERRISDLMNADPSTTSDLFALAQSLCTKVNATLAEVFGLNTVEYERAQARWTSFVVMRVASPFGGGISQREEQDNFASGREKTIGKLKSEIQILQERLEDVNTDLSFGRKDVASDTIPGEDIFIVHGHDDAARAEVARFLEKAGLKAIILHEQHNGGRTVIEKFEAHAATAGFAVVLLTPDDEGGPRGGAMRPRARQNVIAELFYFMGKLGRPRVCALRKGDLEEPSDIAGLVYTPFDPGGAWRIAVLRELEAAGYEVKWDALR